MSASEDAVPPDVSIELVGQDERRIGRSELSALPVRQRSVEVVCATGRRETATWGGVPVPDLLGLGTVPPSTTHLVISSESGYSACIGVEAALGGLLAWTRDGRPLDDGFPYATRFVASDVDGARLVKDVAHVEAVALTRQEDPRDYETIGTDSPEVDE